MEKSETEPFDDSAGGCVSIQAETRDHVSMRKAVLSINKRAQIIDIFDAAVISVNYRKRL